MGSEQSQIPGLEIDEKATEVSDFWSQHSASILSSGKVSNVSVFIGELYIDGSLWISQTPLERNIKNLMIYRHPCIVKYISSWQKNSKYYLVVEEAIPLSHIISKLSIVQISVGLHSVLKALCFLHNNAATSHNNVCTTSVYVTRDGRWKLGGMEYLCSYKELCRDYLSKTKTSRYGRAVDLNEEKFLHNNLGRKDFIDVYAFGVLAFEILKNNTNDDIASASAFLDYCKNEMQNSDITLRPTFKAILQHDFFNHDFVVIHSFLVELPLKSDSEKSQFFKMLPEKLRTFDEVLIASQLGVLLLSRLIVLNKSAQNFLLPLILSTRGEISPSALFSEETFKKFLCPIVLDIFRVRDAQIRLVLLENFCNYVHTFTIEELQSSILPELLVGIKDTNDTLVSVTLRTLADLVPILGASTVIGGKRAKLFNDGIPATQSFRRFSKNVKISEVIISTPIVECATLEDGSLNNGQLEINNVINLSERPRPDGEEETSNDEIEYSVDGDLDNWEDWDMNEGIPNNADRNEIHSTTSQEYKSCATEDSPREFDGNQLIFEKTVVIDKQIPNVAIPDISELDIKNQVNSKQNDIDFFEDMEPVIDKNNTFLIAEVNKDYVDKEVKKKLALKTAEDIEDGWGDGDWE